MRNFLMAFSSHKFLQSQTLRDSFSKSTLIRYIKKEVSCFYNISKNNEFFEAVTNKYNIFQQ